MADEIVFSDLPITASQTGPMPLSEVIDVSGYDELDLLLGVQQLASSGSLTISISTSMHDESEEGWVTASTFDTVTVAGVYQKITVRNFLRFVRYHAVASNGGGMFTLSGIARSWR